MPPSCTSWWSVRHRRRGGGNVGNAARYPHFQPPAPVRSVARVDFRRRAVAQGLVPPLIIIEGEVATQSGPRFPRAGVLMQVDLLVFHAAPQPLGEDVVQRPPASIHANALFFNHPETTELYTLSLHAAAR